MPDPASPASLLRTARTDHDALNRLRAIRQLLEAVNQLTVDAVRLARQQDRSWTQIGEALGITRQSAHSRFGNGD